MPDFIVIDTTSFEPKWKSSNGETGDIWPTFCLPFFPGEPSFVNKEAKLHRRHTKLESFSTEEKINDDNNMSRWHWGDGWMRFNRHPDSIRASKAKFGWSPLSLMHQGSSNYVSYTFVEILKQLIDQVSSDIKNVCLIVPSGLGPGPVGELYNELRHDYEKILLMPRDLAAATQWAGDAQIDRETLSPGDEYGDLLVTSFTPDDTEQALIQFYVEEDGGLCPIHDRTKHTTELDMPGMSWIIQNRENSWREQPYPNLSVDPSRQGRDYIENILSVARENPFSYSRFNEEVEDDVFEYITERNIDQDTLKAIIHNGPLIEKKLPPYQRQFFRNIEIERALSSQDLSLRGGYVAMKNHMRGKTPYYQRVTPLELKVNTHDEFFDLSVSWSNLLDASGSSSNALLPAGKTFQTAKPLTNLSIRPNLADKKLKVDIRVIELRQLKEKRIELEIEEEIEEEIPLIVKAEINPGTGLAKIDLQAKSSPKDFHKVVDENAAKPMPQETANAMHSWPSKSACVIPPVRNATRHDLSRQSTIGIMQMFAEAPRTNPLSNNKNYVGDLFNSWQAPENYNALVGHIPPLFRKNKKWLYMGGFPSHDTPVNDEEMVNAHKNLLDTLKEEFSVSQSESRLNDLCRIASWTYLSCPQRILKYVREEIKEYIDQGDSELHPGILSVVGNCFESDNDCSLFFKCFLKHMERNPVQSGAETTPLSRGSIEYIRAYRNLARFRANALQTEILSRTAQDAILEWTVEALAQLIVYGKRVGTNSTKTSVNYIARLAPHILKRRRFDPKFLSEEDGEKYERFREDMEYLSRQTRAYFFNTTIQSAIITLKFLLNKATDQDMADFMENDS